MTYELKLEEHPGYLHAKVTGERTVPNTMRYLMDVYAACVKRGFSNVLLEMDFHGPSLGSFGIFNVIADRSADGSKLRRIAYVERSPAEKAEFAETVAVNRGVNVRLFADVSEAARWLEEDAAA